MPAKKTTAKKATAKKEEPKGPEVEGFEVVDYEGMDLLQCQRCEFNTFDLGSAEAHGNQHDAKDKDLAELAELTEHLPERAQVTEVADDDG